MPPAALSQPQALRGGCENVGRSKYETNVRPNLEKISEMALTMTEAQICQVIGVGHNAWIRYKDEHEELRSALKKGRAQLVAELKSTLIMKAKGYEYTEKKQIFKDGVLVSEEIYTKYAHPDTGAAHLLLKNLDDSWRNDDMETVKQKRRQLDIAQQKADDAEYS